MEVYKGVAIHLLAYQNLWCDSNMFKYALFLVCALVAIQVCVSMYLIQ